MTHFGIICPAVAGHLNPMTTLGYELRNRGHQVTVVGILDAEKKAHAAGLDFKAIATSEYPYGSIAQISDELGKLSGLAALRYTINSLQKSTVTLLQQAPQTIKEAGIDALLVDQVSSAGGTVADYLSIPFVSVSSALMLNEDTSIPPFNTSWSYSPTEWAKIRNKIGYILLSRVRKPIRATIAQYRREWNLPPHHSQNDVYSSLAQLCQQPAEFEFPRENLPRCFHFTGAYHNPVSRAAIDFPYEKLTGQPLIYASMGTLQNRLMGIFESIAQACAEIDAQLVISLGSGLSGDVPKFPGAPLVVKYAPQLELLQKASLTITHAGLNTVLESISHGVPMVAIPIANDQPGVAARVVWTGCGEMIKLQGLNAAKLRSAIERVMTQNSYRNNAIRLQTANQQAGGVAKAADIIERVMSTGKPVLAGAN
ncbi:glycosyltransferase [Aliterella atlantica]|uniref:Glycosyl transferase family 1 n=1 Tax=Aliterella atlantica CENA595 TaxID=1618023 RepID=A0A0D8ZRI3_9CYAN|nr:glycosyltransferase [Aliterella atlantica]KJH71330.1 glycosyl transferase family 1 [Aliterella atlantica CENA595]